MRCPNLPTPSTDTRWLRTGGPRVGQAARACRCPKGAARAARAAGAGWAHGTQRCGGITVDAEGGCPVLLEEDGLVP